MMILLKYFCGMLYCYVLTKNVILFYFFKLKFTPFKAAEPVRGKELQGKEKHEKPSRKLFKKNLNDKRRILTLKLFRS